MEDKRKRDKNTLDNFILTAAFLIGFISLGIAIAVLIGSGDNYKLYNIFTPIHEEPIILKDGIDVYTDDGRMENMNLPAKLDSKYVYSYDFVVEPLENGNEAYVNINPWYFSFELRDGDELISSFKKSENPIVESMAYGFMLIKIPEKSLNKNLTVSFISNLKGKRDIIVPGMMIGSKASIVNTYLKNEFPIIIIFLVLLTTSVYFIILSCIYAFKKKEYKGFMMLALLDLNMAIYVLLRAWIIFYYFNDPILAYFMENTCTNIMLAPIFIYFISIFEKNSYFDWRIKTLNYIAGFIFLDAIAQVVITLSGYSEFILMKSLTLLIYIVGMLILGVILFTADKNRLKNKKYLILSIFPIIAFSVLTSIFYIITNEIMFTSFAALGFLWFLLFNLFMFVKEYSNMHMAEVEDKFYREIAFFDSLSGIANKNAFDRDLATLSVSGKRSSILLCMLDINNLKLVNDGLGHKAGDRCIKASADALKVLADEFEDSFIYRYSGDEYYFISYDKSPRESGIIIEKIRKDIAGIDFGISDINVGLAFGYEYRIIDENFNLAEILESVDKKMYMDKKRKKGVEIEK